jgi:diguanylate cyclase (GGDEF)-like protein/PAS domain S-box-containing protein
VAALPLLLDKPSTEGRSPEQLLEELLVSHARFPALFDANLEPKVLFDLSGSFIAANAAALRLLGRRMNVLRGERFARALSRHMGSHEAEAFALAKSGRTARVATSIASASGAVVALEATLFPAIVDGTTVGIYACAVDVTSRLNRERAIDRRTQELSSLFLRHADSTISFDEFGRVRSVNAAFERLLGYSADELVGRPFTSLIVDDSILRIDEAFKSALQGQTSSGSALIKHKSGEPIELTGVVVPIVVDERVVGVYAVGHDNVDQRSENQRMRELYLLAANATHGAEAQLATALNIGRKRLGCREAYVARVDGDRLTYVHCAGNSDRREGMHAELAGSADASALDAGEPIFTTHDGIVTVTAPLLVGMENYGTIAFVEDAPGALKPDDADYVRLIASLASSAIERGEQLRRLDALALYDVLTGLPNRANLAERLQDTIAKADRDAHPFALHFIDLDHFKAVNDTDGHARGDAVLATIGKTLERTIGGANMVARVGGDEFVVVQPGANDRAEARALAERIRMAIAEPFVIGGVEYRLTASVGIGFFPDDGLTPGTLLAHADAALYKVKGSGRDAIAFA